MSYRLMAEVLDHAPDDLTDGEARLLLALAEWANDETRECWPGRERLMRRMRRDRWDAVAKLLRGLSDRGCEVRVQLRDYRGQPLSDRHGRPLYAASGHRSTYRVPRFAEGVPNPHTN